jgi:hypothetical protein
MRSNAMFTESCERHVHSLLPISHAIRDWALVGLVVSASDPATAVALEIALVVASQQLIPADLDRH